MLVLSTVIFGWVKAIGMGGVAVEEILEARHRELGKR